MDSSAQAASVGEFFVTFFFLKTNKMFVMTLMKIKLLQSDSFSLWS